MNILMMTLLYPKDQMQEIAANIKDKWQNQINSYQYAFIEGILSNLSSSDSLEIVNSLPVGIFPLQYSQLFLKAGKHDGGRISQLGCINLPLIKQKGRAKAAEKALLNWVKRNSNNRVVLIYTQYLPYMQAIVRVKKRFPDLKAAVIVTDLPNEWGLATGRTGVLKQIEKKMGQDSLKLLREMDGYVLLTDPMADALQVRHKPLEVIEGLIISSIPEAENAALPARPAFLYTGTLERDLGIREMLDAFQKMPEYDLWICGFGGMKTEVEDAAKRYANIHFYGFVTQKEALAKQANATALLNPRQPNGLFTRYSFPSKTLEYMRSGKPVLCCRLEGIPKDYEPYLCYMEQGAEGVVQAVRTLMKRSSNEREALGRKARDYVLQSKNPEVQCKKLISLLRRL